MVDQLMTRSWTYWLIGAVHIRSRKSRHVIFLVLALFGLQWIFPKSIKLLILGWNWTRMQKRAKKKQNLAFFCLF